MRLCVHLDFRHRRQARYYKRDYRSRDPQITTFRRTTGHPNPSPSLHEAQPCKKKTFMFAHRYNDTLPAPSISNLLLTQRRPRLYLSYLCFYLYSFILASVLAFLVARLSEQEVHGYVSGAVVGGTTMYSVYCSVEKRIGCV